jgi:hypothetical protein
MHDPGNERVFDELPITGDVPHVPGLRHYAF